MVVVNEIFSPDRKAIDSQPLPPSFQKKKVIDVQEGNRASVIRSPAVLLSLKFFVYC